MTGSEAWEYFQGDPDAFKCYHNGFAEQVLVHEFSQPTLLVSKRILIYSGFRGKGVNEVAGEKMAKSSSCLNHQMAEI